MLRPIDVSELERVQPIDQPAPILDWVRIDRIVMDDDFQRPLGRNNREAIRRIAENFQWSRFSPVLLAPIEGGLFSCIDGQHRAHAAALCGFEAVPAMVAIVPKSEQARAFVHVNSTQIRVSAHQVYKAALAAKEPWAIQCRDAVHDAGCRLMFANASTASKKAGEIYAIGLIKGLIGQGKAWAVTSGLRAIRDFDEQQKPALYSDYVLGPWLTAVAADGAHASADLVAVLRTKNPYNVIETADRLAKLEGKPLAVTRRNAFVALIRKAGRQEAAE